MYSTRSFEYHLRLLPQSTNTNTILQELSQLHTECVATPALEFKHHRRFCLLLYCLAQYLEHTKGVCSDRGLLWSHPFSDSITSPNPWFEFTNRTLVYAAVFLANATRNERLASRESRVEMNTDSRWVIGFLTKVRDEAKLAPTEWQCGFTSEYVSQLITWCRGFALWNLYQATDVSQTLQCIHITRKLHEVMRASTGQLVLLIPGAAEVRLSNPNAVRWTEYDVTKCTKSPPPEITPQWTQLAMTEHLLLASTWFLTSERNEMAIACLRRAAINGRHCPNLESLERQNLEIPREYKSIPSPGELDAQLHEFGMLSEQQAYSHGMNPSDHIPSSFHLVTRTTIVNGKTPLCELVQFSLDTPASSPEK